MRSYKKLAFNLPRRPARLDAAMLAENDQRRDLSPLEQGRMFERLIKDIFKKQCPLAEALGRDPGDVSRVLTLARLPPVVLKAMVSPLDLTIHDADRLGPLLKNDLVGLRDAAKQLLHSRGPLAARDVVRELSGGATKQPRLHGAVKTVALPLDGAVHGAFALDAAGGVTVSIRTPLSEAQRADLLDRMQRFLIDTFGVPA